MDWGRVQAQFDQTGCEWDLKGLTLSSSHTRRPCARGPRPPPAPQAISASQRLTAEERSQHTQRFRDSLGSPTPAGLDDAGVLRFWLLTLGCWSQALTTSKTEGKPFPYIYGVTSDLHNAGLPKSISFLQCTWSKENLAQQWGSNRTLMTQPATHTQLSGTRKLSLASKT